MIDQPILEARRIGRRNPSEKTWLLDNVEFQLSPGRRMALVGPTGSGKTLLLRALALLDPIDSGEILWRGQPIANVPSYRARVMYLHQRPALFPGDVETNLRLPFSLAVHRGRQFDRERVLRDLSFLGRDSSFLARSVADLSGGEGQITSLLRAIQLDPNVLLLDEPTSALDRDSATAVEVLLRRWQQSNDGRSYIWVSHDRSQVDRVAEQTVVINGGRLEDGDSSGR